MCWLFASAATSLLFVWGLSVVRSQSQEQLRCVGGQFKIVQFTDTHFGENESDDLKGVSEMTQLLQWENPQLVALSGDIVSGYSDTGDPKWWPTQFAKAMAPMLATATQWAFTFGNHDDNGNWKRAEIIEFVANQSLSHTRKGPADIGGVSNYVLTVFDDSGLKPVWNVWFLDSLDEDCYGVEGYGCVELSTVQWYLRKSAQLEAAFGRRVPALMFVHIPIPEMLTLFNSQTTSGYAHDSALCCASLNTGLFAALRQRNEVRSLWHGHDHSNDFYGQLQGVTLGYGRKTAYGGYGPTLMKRGARVLALRCDAGGHWHTYVRQNDGSVLSPNNVTSNAPANWFWPRWRKCAYP